MLFNNIDLTNYIVVSKIRRSILPPSSINSIQIPSRHGAYFAGRTYGVRVIEVDYGIMAKSKEERIQIVRNLAWALNSESPTKLILPDETDKFYYAIISDDTDFEPIISIGKGTLKFLCLDPTAHGVNPKVFYGDDSKIATVYNSGTTDVFPIINVLFSKPSQFLQVTSFTGETILVGQRPTVDKITTSPMTMILRDTCEATTNWVASGQVVDSGRLIEGTIGVSSGGGTLIATNYGTTVNGEWHGPGSRRNIGSALTNFEVVARFEHSSKGSLNGTGSGSSAPSNGSTYTVTSTTLRLRSGRGTSYSILKNMSKGTKVVVTNISKGWGQITYQGSTGYASMDYLKLDTPTTQAISPTNRAEPKMGRIELYGFDTNGQKLFKMVIRDSEEYYEYTQPELEIGSKLVLDDKKSCPNPKKKSTKDDKGKVTTSNIDSGMFGDWNDYYGDIKIRRNTNSKGQQQWYGEITKVGLGTHKVIRTIKTSTLISNSYPSGALSHLVIWFGKYKDKPTCDVMALHDIQVKQINNPDDSEVTTNQVIFDEGDILEIDNGSGDVTLNGKPFEDQLDIGSQFFTLPSDTSQIICHSDDANIDVAVEITERWL
jgi:predicted phage tail component-like protein